ncbi:hypothetical protein FISHEDRAFT_7225, partial [Fistulina hepatica ATCC 64428]
LESSVDKETAKLSKRALKRAAKEERYAAYRIARREKDRVAKKERKRIHAEKRATDEVGDEPSRKKRKVDNHNFEGRLIIDLGFDNLMNEREIKSLTSQLAYTYAANRKASFPFALIHTSLNGKTAARLESIGGGDFKRWQRTQWWEDGYERLWKGDDIPEYSYSPDISDSPPTVAPAPDDVRTHSSSDAIKSKVVYLTADSDFELEELHPDEYYIIGGICDHNRYKNLCLERAQSSGVRTARLPIGHYLDALPTRKVLTVNQVVEIMLKWVESRSWEEALYTVVPKRKFQGGDGR